MQNNGVDGCVGLAWIQLETSAGLIGIRAYDSGDGRWQVCSLELRVVWGFLCVDVLEIGSHMHEQSHRSHELVNRI